MSKPIVVIACMFSSSESWEPQTAPTSLALTCRWRSRPQHQEATYAVQQIAAYSITSSARAGSVGGTVRPILEFLSGPSSLRLDVRLANDAAVVVILFAKIC